MRCTRLAGRTVDAVTRNRWLDFAVAVALTATSQAEIWTAHLRHPIAAAATTAVVTLTLTVRRRWPMLVGGLALTVLCLHQLVIGDVEHASAFTVVAIVVATFSLGAHARGRTALAVGAAGAVGFAVVSAVKGKPIGDVAFVAVVLFAPWLAGLELHRRASRVRQLEAHATDLG